MRQRSDHAMRRASGKLSIGVERNDEANLGQDGKVPDLEREAVEVSLQELIQIQQFPALAFPSHPGALARVVDPVPVKQKERAFLPAGILVVQFANQIRTQ